MSTMFPEVFTTEQVASAADIPLTRLAGWFRHGFALAPTEVPGTGRARYFSLTRALHIALAARLIEAGLTVPVASRLALRFTDLTVEGRGSVLGEPTPEPDRLPGRLYSDDDTVFRVFFHKDREPTVSVDRLRDVVASPFMDGHARADSVLLIELGDLVSRVTHRLIGRQS